MSASIVITRTKIVYSRELGEYQVKAYSNNTRYRPADYFTDDLEDAQNTANAMVAGAYWNAYERGDNPRIVAGEVISTTPLPSSSVLRVRCTNCGAVRTDVSPCCDDYYTPLSSVRPLLLPRSELRTGALLYSAAITRSGLQCCAQGIDSSSTEWARVDVRLSDEQCRALRSEFSHYSNPGGEFSRVSIVRTSFRTLIKVYSAYDV